MVNAPPRTLLTDLATGQTLLVQVVLRVLQGRSAACPRPLPAGTIVVGSGKDVDIPVQDPRVSRRHCTFTLEPDGVRVVDLNSKNGTRVNGVEVSNALVRPGSIVDVGETSLLLDGCDDVNEAVETLGGLTAGSSALQRAFSVLRRAARSDVTVLLLGESGVGKDVVARALHRESTRHAGPFVVVDCGAIAPGLIGSELFGHKKGAFTSASHDRLGAFETAAGGTLFLDELGELPLELQPTLLRVLESRQVTRVGENVPRPIDVRVVAATNRDLAQEVHAGRFRRDLFHRLAVVTQTIAPLRERRQELLSLTARFLEDHGRSLRELSGADRARLQAHSFDGNIRELRNMIDRSVALATPGQAVRLAFDDEPTGPATTPTAASMPTTPQDVLDVLDVHDLLALPWSQARAQVQHAFDGRYLAHLLDACDGNVSAAARKAGVARSYLHRLLQAHPELRRPR